MEKVWASRATAAAALVLALASPAAAGEDLARLLFDMEAAYARVQSYTARFVRQEVVGGGLRPREEALLKFQRPGLMYLQWIAGPPEGREILFVPGRNHNRMLVREPGWLSSLVTVAIAPDSPRVLRESRHPVTDVGLGRLIELIVDNARRAAAAGELTLKDHGIATGPEGPARRLEAVLPRDGQGRYYCYRLELTVATGSGLPVRATIYDWADRYGGRLRIPRPEAQSGVDGRRLRRRQPGVRIPSLAGVAVATAVAAQRMKGFLTMPRILLKFSDIRSIGSDGTLWR